MAMSSLLVSTTNRILGKAAISLMPPRARSSLFFSRVSCSNSFLVRPVDSSPASCSSSTFNLLTDAVMVFQLVIMPPSQR